jgi:tetratricopeptide (TPR) repeat protein
MNVKRRSLLLVLIATIVLATLTADPNAAGLRRYENQVHQPAAESAAGRHLEQGAAALRQGRTVEAIAALKRSLALDPGSGLGHQLLAEAYLQQGTYEMMGEARAELLQALSLDPSLVWARFYLARLYLDFGEAAKAGEQLTAAVEQRSDVPHLQSLLGETERQLGRPAESIARQKRALGIDPAFAPARYYLGLALLDMKEAGAALEALEAAAASNLPIPDLHLTLGRVYEDQKRLDRAQALYERAVEVAPDRGEARLRLARLQRLRGNPAAALEQLSRALPSGKRLLATQYYQQFEADVHLERGRAFQDLERWDDASRAYTDAIAVLPDLGEAHRQLAEVLYRRGQYGRALEHAGRAGALGHPVRPDLLAQITARANK